MKVCRPVELGVDVAAIQAFGCDDSVEAN